MVLNIYALPAIFALVAKLGILFYSRFRKPSSFQSNLFTATVLFSLLMSVAEIGLLQKRVLGGDPWPDLVLYFASSIPVAAFLAHLAALISFDSISFKHRVFLLLPLYGTALFTEWLLLGTPWLLDGVTPFGAYTFGQIPGRLYWVYESYLLVACLLLVVLPLYGLRRSREPFPRNQCKLWVLTAAPVSVLVIIIVTLLHVGINVINSTVTLPILLAIHLGAIGYAVHSPRIIDVNYFQPRSSVRLRKNKLYREIMVMLDNRQSMASERDLIAKMAEVFRCPIALIGKETTEYSSEVASTLIGFPRELLYQIEEATIANEVDRTNAILAATLKSHHVAAIFPIFPRSQYAARWLIFGEGFNDQIHTPTDFEVLRNFVERLGESLVDTIAGHSKPDGHVLDRSILESTRNGSPTFNQTCTLDEYIAEIERQIIKETLHRLSGNQAAAARELGIRANTLHYKIRKYSI